jgi:hypothetical protein
MAQYQMNRNTAKSSVVRLGYLQLSQCLERPVFRHRTAKVPVCFFHVRSRNANNMTTLIKISECIMAFVVPV